MANAIGILETKGLTALVKGVDAMLKAANVTLAGQYKVGKVVSVDVIARPHEDLSKTVLAAAAAKAPAKK